MGFSCSEWSFIAQKKVLRDPEVGVMEGSGQGQVTIGHHIHMKTVMWHMFLGHFEHRMHP